MASHFQAVPLVASPSYPNSIAWSEENLVAIASGNLITILNPSLLVGPRGVVTLPPNKPFPIGVVQREDLLMPCLLPICLSRETRPCARSLSWSPMGFAPNSGCLLAVSTTEGCVKLYRAPVCELCAEWVEVMDISDKLYDYFAMNNFGELNVPFATSPQEQIIASCIKESASDVSWKLSACNVQLQDSVSSEVRNPRKRKMPARFKDGEQTSSLVQKPRYDANRDTFHQAIDRDTNPDLESPQSNDKAVDAGSENLMVINVHEGSCPKFEGNPSSEIRVDSVLPLITARQYASRSALLSCLIVAWSPAFQSPQSSLPNCISNNYAILAVGGKSGNISFWRFTEPECYTIEHGGSIDAKLIGLLHAHNSWITAISWGVCACGSSDSQFVLASGSSDGSVKMWLADVKGLIKSSEADVAPFSLFKEVTVVTCVPISTISLAVPVQSLDKVIMAIGKGSGSLEVWICHICSNKLESAGVYNAHDQVVTGLSWTFDGRYLYTSSQDNTLRSWFLDGNYLRSVPFSSKFPSLKNSTNLSEVTDQCLGLAISPGELIIAVVRSFDASLLHQMYQARIQKAVVEFFWIGGQQLTLSSDRQLVCITESISDLTSRDLSYWESNILWSLKRYDSSDKVLSLWDVITALLAFKQFADKFVENLLAKWISSWFSDIEADVPIAKVLSHAQKILSKISIRKMHLLNIISRRLILDEVKANAPNEQHSPSGLNDDKEQKLDLWNKLLLSSERELQERLVAFTFRKNCVPSSTTGPTLCTTWSPVGVEQMRRWVLINSEIVHQQLKLLGSGVGEHGSRLHSLRDDEEVETCPFCYARVPFESPEFAWCEGIELQDGSRECHTLGRCAVSMQLGSVTSPMWFCVCCRRSAANLPPQTFFTVPKSPLDLDCEERTFTLQEGERSRPLCPFCGILLQRLLPDFLLSASPV